MMVVSANDSERARIRAGRAHMRRPNGLCVLQCQTVLKGDVLFDMNCLLTDVGVPTIDCFRVRREPRATNLHLLVNSVTGICGPADQRRAAVNDLQRPFGAATMIGRITNALPTQTRESNDGR
jgi:FixJ family two-component response regulator